MKQRFFVLAIIAALALSSCAMGGYSETSTISSSYETSTISSSYSEGENGVSVSFRDTENVKLRYDIIKTNAIPIYKCKSAELLDEAYLNLFSDNPTVKEEDFSNSGRTVKSYSIGDENGLVIYQNGILQRVSYNTTQGFNYIAVENETQYADNKTEFDFMSREELSKEVSSIIKELLGVDISTTIDAVTAERFSRDVDEHIAANAELFDNPATADKYGTPANFYVVSFNQTIDGTPCEGTFGNVIYTSNGMEYLYIYNPITTVSQQETSEKFLSLAQTEEFLKGKYDLLLISEPVTFVSAELVYVNKDSDLLPAWKFTADFGTVEYYNAYTGKEIVWDFGEGA